MFTTTRSMMFWLTIALLCGCQNSGGTAKEIAEPPAAVAVCPKCEALWPRYTDRYGRPRDPHATKATKWTQNMKCPDCESAVVTLFKTGQLRHRCETCGAVLLHCKPERDGPQ